MDSTTAVTVATVLYGGEDVLAETLPTWRAALQSVDAAVVIIDNSPTEGPSSVVREHLATAVLHRRPANPGFAASANEALRSAPSAWVILLNADVYLAQDSLERCLAWIDGVADPASQCAALSLVTDGREYCGVELNAVGYFSDRPASSRRPPLGPSGGAMVIHRQAFERAGGYDEDLFAWGEDGGLSLRLFALGISTAALGLGLEHIGGHSIPSIEGLRFKARLLARNRLRVMRRDWTGPLRLLLGPPQLVLILANGVRKARAGTGRAHFHGVVSGLLEPSARRGRPRLGVRSFARYRLAR